MNALEIRLIAYVLAGLSVIGGTAWATHILDAHHYERLEALEEIARDQAIQVQQQKAIADLQAQQAATRAAETQYETLKASAADTADRLARSVSNYTALRRGLVSATATTAALADAASQGASRDNRLAEAVRRATDACLTDAAALTALQQWSNASAPSQSQ